MYSLKTLEEKKFSLIFGCLVSRIVLEQIMPTLSYRCTDALIITFLTVTRFFHDNILCFLFFLMQNIKRLYYCVENILSGLQSVQYVAERVWITLRKCGSLFFQDLCGDSMIFNN